MKRWAGVFAAVGTLWLALALGGASGSIQTAPANDNFSNAIVLSGAHVTRTGDTNVGATKEVGEPTTIAGQTSLASVWYSWTATENSEVTIQTATSNFDTLLGVYTGSAVDTLTEVVSNDDADYPDDLWSSVTFSATAGTSYAIAVDGVAATGTINLQLYTGPPPNDDFANAVVLTGRTATRGGDWSINATLETDEPDTVAGSPASGSVWYSWAPAESGRVTIDTATSDFDTLLGVYTGSAVGTLTEVASNDDVDGSNDQTSSVTLDVAAGTNYRIRVDGYLDSFGIINLHLALVTAPGTPTGVAATAGDGQATVSWSAPASNGGGSITGYDVTRYVAGSAQGTTSFGVVAQATVTGLANGTTYTFKVAAKNVVGTGALSAESNAVTPKTLPGVPTGVAATAGDGQATVSWSAPASNGGSSITGYDVTRYVAGSAQGTTSFGVVAQATVTGLANGTTYTFKVAAKNVVGTGALSAESNAVTPKVPRFTLTVTKSGTGAGTVTSSVGGIACGAICTGEIDAGTSVTLTATPDAGSTFAGWSGACAGASQCTVTMDAAKAASATFAQILLPVTRPVKCVVPNVKGKLLATAKRRITAAHCRVGRVTRAKSKTVAKGKVISQSPRSGKRLAAGAKVNLVVSRGKR